MISGIAGTLSIHPKLQNKVFLKLEIFNLDRRLFDYPWKMDAFENFKFSKGLKKKRLKCFKKLKLFDLKNNPWVIPPPNWEVGGRTPVNPLWYFGACWPKNWPPKIQGMAGLVGPRNPPIIHHDGGKGWPRTPTHPPSGLWDSRSALGSRDEGGLCLTASPKVPEGVREGGEKKFTHAGLASSQKWNFKWWLV